MRQLIPIVILTALLPAAPLAAAPMTAGERQRLVAHLEMTNAWLESEVAGLSKAQVTFKPTPESWSVMEVVEHLAIAEPQYWKNFQDSLARPAQPGFKPQATDLAMLWYGIDRTNRATTGEARVPRGTFATLDDSLAAFRKLRAEMLQVARTTEEDLRGRQYLEASQDLYQWFLMISSHAQRHILQIREVKAHKDFPKRQA
jgi:DinB superfamily